MTEEPRATADLWLMKDIVASLDEVAMPPLGFDIVETSDIPTDVIELKGKVLTLVGTVHMHPAGLELDWLQQESSQLRMENYALRKEIRAIQERLANIEASIARTTGSVAMLREISKEQAEKEILELFSTGQTLYYSDIAEQLGLDLQLVVEICSDLQSRGEIEVVDDTLPSR